MKKAQFISSETAEINRMAKEFFLKHLSPDDPLPKQQLINGNYGSYYSRRERQWDTQIALTYEDMEFKIINRAENSICSAHQKWNYDCDTCNAILK